MRREREHIELGVHDADRAGIFFRRRLSVDLLDDAPFDVGLGHHHLGGGGFEIIALEQAERQRRLQQDQDRSVGVGLAAVEDPRFLEAQPVACRATHHRDIVERGVDRRHDRLFALAKPVDQQQAEGLSFRLVAAAARQFVPQLVANPPAILDTEVGEVEKRAGGDGEILCAEAERDDAVVAPAVRRQLAGGGAAEDRDIAKNLGKFGGELMRIVGRRSENQGHRQAVRR